MITNDEGQEAQTAEVDIAEEAEVDVAAPPEPEPARPTRAARVKARDEGLTHRVAEAEARAASAAAETARISRESAEREERTQRELAEIRNAVGARPDASAKRVEDLEKQMEDEMIAVHQSEGKRDLSNYRRLERERMGILATEAAQRIVGGERSSQATPQQMALTAEFPEVMGDDRARSASLSYMDYLVTVKKRPANLATAREAASHVASEMGLGGARAERPTDRSAGNLPPSRGTSPPASSSGRKTRVTLTDAEMEFAKEQNIDVGRMARSIAEADPSRLH